MTEPTWWVCPNEPPCAHGAVLHDRDADDDPKFMCCAEGCGCGHPAAVVAGRGPADGGGAALSLADALKASLTDAKASRGAADGMGPCDDLAACGNPRCQYCHPAGRGAADGQTT